MLNKDIRVLKKNFFYYIFFRLVRKFLNNKIIIKIYGFRLLVSQNKNSTSHFLLKKCDFSELAEINLIKKISLKNDVLFIDGGCNYGFFSFFVASLKKGNEIISVDASNKICDEFRENLKINNFKNIKLFNYALSNQVDKKIKFYEALNDWESSALNSGFKKKNTLFIETTTIDKIIHKKNLKEKKIIIKLDLEGFEIQAIYGSKNTIKMYKPLIIIELSKYIKVNNEFNLKSLEKFLDEANYFIYDLKGKKTNIKEIEDLLNNLDQKHQTIGNFYLVYKSLNILNYIE